MTTYISIVFEKKKKLKKDKNAKKKTQPNKQRMWINPFQFSTKEQYETANVALRSQFPICHKQYITRILLLYYYGFLRVSCAYVDFQLHGIKFSLRLYFILSRLTRSKTILYSTASWIGWPIRGLHNMSFYCRYHKRIQSTIIPEYNYHNELVPLNVMFCLCVVSQIQTKTQATSRKWE